MPSGFFLKEKPPRTLFARARLLWFRSKLAGKPEIRVTNAELGAELLMHMHCRKPSRAPADGRCSTAQSQAGMALLVRGQYQKNLTGGHILGRTPTKSLTVAGEEK
jgi:hypothetical protein